MNWEAMGAIGDLLGGVGVIITLIYLALQIRQNTHQLRRAEVNVTMDQYSAYRRAIMSDPELAVITSEGFANPEGLGPADRVRAGQAMVELIFLNYNEWRRREAGTMFDDEDVEFLRKSFVEYTLATPLGREIWSRIRTALAPSYRNSIDRLLDASEAGR